VLHIWFLLFYSLETNQLTNIYIYLFKFSRQLNIQLFLFLVFQKNWNLFYAPFIQQNYLYNSLLAFTNFYEYFTKWTPKSTTTNPSHSARFALTPERPTQTISFAAHLTPNLRSHVPHCWHSNVDIVRKLDTLLSIALFWRRTIRTENELTGRRVL